MKKIIAASIVSTLLSPAITSVVAGTTNSATDEWSTILDQLLPAGEIAELISDPADERLRYELYRWIFLSLADSYEINVASDPNFPLWSSHFLNYPRASIGVSPDVFYLSSVLEGDGIYKIWGNRGTNNSFSIQFGSPLTTPGKEGLSRTLATHDIDDLTLNNNGDFEVLVSPEKPADWKGDWWPLSPDTGFAFARLLSYNWAEEKNGTLHIERLNPKQHKPQRKSIAELKQQINGITRFAVANARRWVDHVAELRRSGIINQFRISTMQSFGGWGEQRYWEGFYDIADDEALVIGIELPKKVAFWNIQLSSETWESLDYFNRISSINGLQAIPASDGKIYAVIANQDPAVPNWLDTGNFNTGHVYGRWNNASSAPLPTVKKVKLTEIRQHLPANTPTVTPQQRAKEINVRRKAIQPHFRY